MFRSHTTHTRRPFSVQLSFFISSYIENARKFALYRLRLYYDYFRWMPVVVMAMGMVVVGCVIITYFSYRFVFVCFAFSTEFCQPIFVTKWANEATTSLHHSQYSPHNILKQNNTTQHNIRKRIAVLFERFVRNETERNRTERKEWKGMEKREKKS